MKGQFLSSIIKKTVILIIAFTIVASPFSYKVASAQLSIGGILGGGASAAFSCTGIGDKINSSISSIFGSTGSSSGGSSGVTQAEQSVQSQGTSTSGGTGGGGSSGIGQSVPTSDAKTKEEVAKLKSKECADAIAYALAKTALAELTKSTVNWINSGFKGSPTYVQNPTSFLKTIADDELSGLVNVIGFDPLNFPFGQAVAQSLISQTQGYFEANARFSLDQIIASNNPGKTSANFYRDFNVGGWGGWLGSIIFPQNNPIGFQFEAENALAARTSGIDYSPIQEAKDQIQRSGGFLDLKKCVSPDTYNENSDETVATMNASLHSNSGTITPEELAGIQYTIKQNTCVRWETQTPGSILASTATKALDSNFDQLALADEVNESLAAVFDALFNQLVGYGLRSLSTNDSNASNISSDFLGGGGSNISTAGTSNSIDQGWFSFQQENVDLVNDIPGIIDIQLKYLGQPTIGTDPLPGFNGIPEMINTINLVTHDVYLLDYCIPGPRPTWYTDVSQNVTTAINAVSDFIANNPIPNQNGAQEFEKKIINTYTEAFDEYAARITGIPFSRQIITTQVNIDTIGYTYATLPLVAPQAAEEYVKVRGYQSDIIPGLNDAMANITTTIQKLQYIHDQAVVLQSSNDPVYVAAQTKVLTDAFNGLTDWMGSIEGLGEIQATNELYKEEDLYAVSLLQQCSAQINDPVYKATLVSNALDNWVTYPGIFEYNSKITGEVIDPTKPGNSWIFANPNPYPGVTLPYPQFKSSQGANEGPNGSCSDPANSCWMTFVPASHYQTSSTDINANGEVGLPDQNWHWVALIGKDNDYNDAELLNLKETFAGFEEYFEVY